MAWRLVCEVASGKHWRAIPMELIEPGQICFIFSTLPAEPPQSLDIGDESQYWEREGGGFSLLKRAIPDIEKGSTGRFARPVPALPHF